MTITTNKTGQQVMDAIDAGMMPCLRFDANGATMLMSLAQCVIMGSEEEQTPIKGQTQPSYMFIFGIEPSLQFTCDSPSDYLIYSDGNNLR